MNISSLEAGERRFHVAASDGERELSIGDVLDTVDTSGQDAVVNASLPATVPRSGA